MHQRGQINHLENLTSEKQLFLLLAGFHQIFDVLEVLII